MWLNLRACRREVQPLEELQCEDRPFRDAEDSLRWALFGLELGDDAVLLNEWPVAAAVRFEGEHRYGVPMNTIPSHDPGGAWAYDPAIRDERDLDKLTIPQWRHHEAETARRLEAAEELLGDIIPVKLACGIPITPFFCKDAASLIGFNELMLGIALNPETIHRLMAFLRDAALSTIDQVEAMGILTENNNHCYKHLSDSIRQTPAGQPLKASDLWLWSNSQNFELVGPRQFREFLLDYQMPVMRRYGAVSYGCCETLTKKLDEVFSIPNLRIFVNSPWTDLKAATPYCARRGACLEWRQMATDMAIPNNFEHIEKKLREGLAITRGVNRFIVLQEVQTVDNDLERFKRWCRLAVRLSEEDAAQGEWR
ncbi:MAG: hypothetical protein BWZ10_02572 [candidate division BRC1 bacterium ADurb.BinA364]|nr:MAG: hypothetical protein BWZ10_02572 [candidate division BRC1 bacterium ADurb.BinA364]